MSSCVRPFSMSAGSKLHWLMSEMVWPVLDERGVEALLREYVSEFEDRTGIRSTFVAGLGEERLDVHTETVPLSRDSRGTDECARAFGRLTRHGSSFADDEREGFRSSSPTTVSASMLFHGAHERRPPRPARSSGARRWCRWRDPDRDGAKPGNSNRDHVAEPSTTCIRTERAHGRAQLDAGPTPKPGMQVRRVCW